MEVDVVFLDTSIFESENFTKGHKLKQLGELSKEGEIQVKITDIVYQEILSRIRKNLDRTEEIFKKAYKDLNGRGKILKNLEEFTPYYPMPKINVEENLIKIKDKIDAFISESNIEIIDSEQASVKEVFKKYFDRVPPFGTGQKKDEFPDAFTLSTIEKWCKTNNKKAYVLAKDGDLINYQSNKNITPIGDFPSFLEKRVKTYQRKKNHQQRLDRIDRLYEENIDKLKSELNTEIEDILVSNLEYWYSENVEEIHDLKLSNMEISQRFIVYVGDYDARIELSVQLNIEANMIISDYNWYNDDDIWHAPEPRDITVNEKVGIPVSIMINHSPPAGLQYADIKIESINNGRDIRV